MFDGLMKMIKGMSKRPELIASSKDTAKERLHLVLMQDRANVSVDFLDLMKQEILDVIKKYIEVDENSIDVRLTNKPNGDGTNGAPALYANIPILDIKEEVIEQMELDKAKSKKYEEPKENKANKPVEKKENVHNDVIKNTSNNNSAKNTNTKNTNTNYKSVNTNNSSNKNKTNKPQNGSLSKSKKGKTKKK